MARLELKRTDGIAYREAVPDGGSEVHPVLCVHGFPESSYMWRHLLGDLAEAGYRGVAPDLPGWGDSPPDPPGTWERHMDALDELRDALGLEPAVLVVHDWGGLIGLRWACERPDAVAAIVASNTGFFPDGKWHGVAETLQTPGEGEQLVAELDRGGFAAFLRESIKGVDEQTIAEYWKPFEAGHGGQGSLGLYRSGDFAKLGPYQGRLAELDVPFLALWGENDPFAPIAGAYRFRNEVPRAEVVVVEGTGHFVYEDDPGSCSREILRFLRENDL